MKIAYDHLIFSEQKYGGISRYIAELASQLDHQGEDVKIFAPLHQNHYLSNLPIQLVTGRGFKSFPPKSARLLKFLNNAISGRQITDWNADVLHKSYFDWPSRRNNDIPTVITLHDMIYELFADMTGLFNNTIKLKKAAIQNADHVICISESTKRDAINILGLSEERISVVPLGTGSFSTTKRNTQLFSPVDRPYLLYVGKRAGYKNFKGFINAVSKSPRLSQDFGIVAFGGKGFSSRELHEFGTLGFAEGQVIQVSGDDELLSAYYRNAEAFVFPSQYEGFGLPPLEAMAQECPVISSNTSSMPEVIGNAAEFFDPDNQEDMTQAIEAVVYSPNRKYELLSLGNKRLQNFTWEKCAERTLQVYEKLI